MNPSHASELLERAAASVTPAETDPASRLVSLGRRSARRRRFAWGATGSVAAAAVAAVVALPLTMTPLDRHGDAAAARNTVSLDGVSVAVPDGWQTKRVSGFDPCTATARTVYLAERWAAERRFTKCGSEGTEWIAIVRKGVGLALNPSLLMIKDKRLIAVGQSFATIPSMWSYRPFGPGNRATGAYISGDVRGRARLLDRITWPAGPPAPASGGLALPARITYATSEAPNMVEASDAKTLNQIRTALAGLRDTVPAGQECVLRRSAAVGIMMNDIIVVLGDSTCPQAVSTHGGRVRVPAVLGRQLLNLIIASDRAAAARSTKD